MYTPCTLIVNTTAMASVCFMGGGEYIYTTVNSVDAELPIVTSFKYLGSLFTSEGGSQADVNSRITLGWMKWKEVSR